MRSIFLIPTFALMACSTTTAINPINDSEPFQFVVSDDFKKRGLPLSSAVIVDDWVFLSGALGTIAGIGFVKRGIEPETRQTMENIKATLAENGQGMDSIVKCTVMLADMAEWPAFNKVYREYFTDNFPARSAFGVNGLAANARVEIECLARMS